MLPLAGYAWAKKLVICNYIVIPYVYIDSCVNCVYYTVLRRLWADGAIYGSRLSVSTLTTLLLIDYYSELIIYY